MGESNPVEIAARALGPEYFDPNQQQRADVQWREMKRDEMRADARRVIAALESAGFKIMRRDPTKEMDRAVTRYTGKAYVFQTMWDAAPAYGTPAPETKSPPPA